MVTVLTIGGSDPTGGAGIQADLQAIASLGAHGAAVVAALTVQDTRRVHATRAVPAEWVARQLSCLLADVPVCAAKTGMLATACAIGAVAEALSDCRHVPVVVDPVMRSTSGHDLLDEDGVRELRGSLLPQAALVTPNLQEAERLTGHEARTIEDMGECARIIAGLGPRAVLVKGGHLEGEVADVLYEGGQAAELPGQRIALSRPVHGTGCAFATVAAVFIGRGHSTLEAVSKAREYIAAGLRNPLTIGGGADVIDYARAAARLRT